jgi:hypothetical protein
LTIFGASAKPTRPYPPQLLRTNGAAAARNRRIWRMGQSTAHAGRAQGAWWNWWEAVAS